jgi:hypothetical protein
LTLQEKELRVLVSQQSGLEKGIKEKRKLVEKTEKVGAQLEFCSGDKARMLP